MTLANSLADQGIRLRSYANGNYKIRCPNCSDQRKNKADPCLSVTVSEDGAKWKCHNGCGFDGGVSDRESATITRLRTPPEAIPAVASLTREASQYLVGERMLSRHVIELMGVGSAVHFLPAKNASLPVIAFPYREPGGRTVNVKFRSFYKDFAQVRGAKKTLYGWDCCDLSADQVVICEGEIDQLSLMSAGVVNPISVPDGAADRKLDDCFGPEFGHFGRVVIAGDADEAGQNLAAELARRFGFERCWKVQWPEGCKDANDVLVKHGAETLAECVSKARPYPVGGVHLFDEYDEKIWGLYGGALKRGASTGWSAVDKLMTIRTGELSVVSGWPGSGKSELVDAMCVNLAMSQGWRFAVCSFENPPDEHFAKLAEKFIGKPFFDGPRAKMSEAEVRRAREWVKDQFVLIRAEDEAPTIDWILERARVVAIRHGVRGLVIDPYGDIEHKRDRGMSETEYVGEVLAKVKRFAANHGVHVWFVAHPAKPQRNRDGAYPVPSLYDISGSAMWANRADIGLVVERDYESSAVKVHVKKVRFRIVGTVGVATLQYDRGTGIYRESEPELGSRAYRDD